MTVRGLFYNTPARLKFMKSDRAEGAACVLSALRCALGHPEVSVRCIKDGREEFFTPGDGRAESAVYALLGRELAASLLPVSAGGEGEVRASGFTSAPGTGRGSRTAQYFFCNGRFIRSQLLQAAVEQAYKNSLLTGRFPACVIYLDINTAAVDVNVHPAKTEVKFSDERRVFDAVYYAVLGAIERGAAPARDESAVEVSAPKLYNPGAGAERHTLRVSGGGAAYQTRLDLSPGREAPPPSAAEGAPPSARRADLPPAPAPQGRSAPQSSRHPPCRLPPAAAPPPAPPPPRPAPPPRSPRTTSRCASSARPWGSTSWRKKATRSS